MAVAWSKMNQELVETSQEVIKLLEKPYDDVNKFSKALVIQLSRILKVAVELQPRFIDIDITNDRIGSEEVRLRLQNIFQGDKLYKQVFDPVLDGEFVTFSLVNDLCEIYEDLGDFLGRSSKSSESAEWEFKEAFRGHLFQHVLNAMKVLYMEYCKDE